jgi:cytoskeletal protein CcmA (bactofilin family)
MFGNRPRKKAPIQSTRLSSLIAEGVSIDGDIAFASGLRIDGRVKGHLTGQALDGKPAALLVLSDKGHVEGSVRCGDAVVNGTVVGDLDVENFLELQSNAVVTGTIRYRQLKMDVGATVQGQLIRVQPRNAAAPADNVVELGSEKAAAAGAERR